MKLQQKDEINRLRAEGMSYREIADRLSLPLGSVKSVCHRGHTGAPQAGC
ncbi:helix-turn-helix domain-containing protein, partial [Eubacteriales bacterium OttesenSCG-928-A19]|nr:helix-turn-helix domain-containing protein [Eubacteriales bacterium OttesenSCG-928-A19]